MRDVAVADTVKEPSTATISVLNRLKTEAIMLTGDNEKTARTIGQKVAINKIIANILRGEKAATSFFATLFFLTLLLLASISSVFSQNTDAFAQRLEKQYD